MWWNDFIIIKNNIYYYLLLDEWWAGATNLIDLDFQRIIFIWTPCGKLWIGPIVLGKWGLHEHRQCAINMEKAVLENWSFFRLREKRINKCWEQTNKADCLIFSIKQKLTSTHFVVKNSHLDSFQDEVCFYSKFLQEIPHYDSVVEFWVPGVLLTGNFN